MDDSPNKAAQPQQRHDGKQIVRVGYAQRPGTKRAGSSLLLHGLVQFEWEGVVFGGVAFITTEGVLFAGVCQLWWEDMIISAVVCLSWGARESLNHFILERFVREAFCLTG